MKLVVFLCVLQGCLGVLSAGTVKRDVADKKTEKDEEVYGDLRENDGDVQKDQIDYYDALDEDEDDHEGPAEADNDVNNVKINSKGQVFVQAIGNVVILPCQASSKDDIVRLWFKDSTPIFQDNINIGNKPNLKLVDGGSLEVKIESPEDFGKYHCRLAVTDDVAPEIVHEITGNISPNITRVYTKEDKTELNLGDSFTLVCEATGSPKPKIQWYKENERLGTEGESLTIENVKAKHAGTYRCLADNKVDKPAHKHLKISVKHQPIISVDKYIVNSDHGKDAELICDVKAYPTPAVVWQRDGENMVSQPPKVTLKKEMEKSILIIRDLSEEDFGQYTCVASNSEGRQMRNLNLVKTPVVRKVEKNRSPEKVKDVILQWRVESKQPISAHELQYRRKGETSWRTLTPDVVTNNEDVYVIKHTLSNLEPGIYETRARSQNKHGWSDYSEIVPFEEDSPSVDIPAQHRTGELTPVGESKESSSTSTMGPSLVLLTVALLVTIQMRQ